MIIIAQLDNLAVLETSLHKFFYPFLIRKQNTTIFNQNYTLKRNVKRMLCIHSINKTYITKQCFTRIKWKYENTAGKLELSSSNNATDILYF